MNNNILSCPFCGSEPDITEKKTAFDLCSAFQIRCSRCHISTLPIAYDRPYAVYNGEVNKTFTRAEARREVVRIWNRREKREATA